jgi:hypothetical protein
MPTYQEDTGSLKIPKRKGGRPPGVPNRPKGEAAAVIDQVQHMFELVQHLLTPEQVVYYKRAFQGKEEFDPMRHSEFFMLLYGVYANNTLVTAIKEKIVSQDIAQTLREYRMGLKELDDMRRAREKDNKKGNESGVVDPTRESKLGALEAILAESS